MCVFLLGGRVVHEVEYAFGAHEYPTTGIFEAEPKQCDGFTFRKSILIGKNRLGACRYEGSNGGFSRRVPRKCLQFNHQKLQPFLQ